MKALNPISVRVGLLVFFGSIGLAWAVQCNLSQTVTSDGFKGCTDLDSGCSFITYDPACEYCDILNMNSMTLCTNGKSYNVTAQLYGGGICGGDMVCGDFGHTYPVGKAWQKECHHTSTTDDCGGG